MTQAILRVAALDVLRGAAVAGMVLVTSPGDWGYTYAPLRHAAWNGWTLADMVFPTFLFSVGLALGLSFPRPLASAAERRLFWTRVVRRVLALMLLGLLIEATYGWSVALAGARSMAQGASGMENLRLPGILQRIAFCYGLAAIIIVASARRDGAGRSAVNARATGIVIAALLLGYWAAMTLIPVPGFGVGRLDPEGNLAAYIDRAIFTPPHLWPLGWAVPGGKVVYDPEGLLSGLPATANVLFGVLVAVAWRRTPERAVGLIAAAGAGLFVAGLLLDPWFAINKRIWTSSFALLSAGFSAVLFAALAVALRSRLVVRLSAPLSVLGGNAILAFTAAMLLGRIYTFPFASGPGSVSPQGWLNTAALGVVGDPLLASLLCAIGMVVAVVLIVLPFHRRGIHFRV